MFPGQTGLVVLGFSSSALLALVLNCSSPTLLVSEFCLRSAFPPQPQPVRGTRAGHRQLPPVLRGAPQRRVFVRGLPARH